MPSKQSCRRSEDIIEGLITKYPDRSRDEFEALSRNRLVHLGHDEGILDDTQFEASILSDTFVVKSYLWSYLDDEHHRARVREYVILCTKIQHRAFLTLKTAYFACAHGLLGPEYTVEAFIKAFLKTPSDAFQALVLPLHLTKVVKNHPLKPFVDITRREFFRGDSFRREEGSDEEYPIDPLQDSLERLITKTGLDNAKKYIATKVRTAVFNHVFVHLHRRVKASLDARKCPEEDSDVGGMRELYDKGETNKIVGPRDRETVSTLREVFMTPQQAREAVDIPDASPTPKLAEVLLHLECCRLAEETPGSFTPFPNASFSRCYQRLCTRIFCLLLGVSDMHVTLNLTPSMARKRAKRLRHDKKRTEDDEKKKKKGYFSMRKNEKDALVSSIETDGVGMSIVLLVERPERVQRESVNEKMTEKQKREYAMKKRQEEIDAMRPFMDRAIWRGLDPGRVNLYTTAERKTSGEDGDETYEKMFYSRNCHLRKCGRDRMRAWRDKRAQKPEISTALNALAVTGGAKTHVASRWFSYLSERARYLDVMEEEFLLNDSRCKMKMTQFRLSQRALARAADRLIMEGNEEIHDGRKVPRRPVIIGYGNGRGNGGGHKGEQGVPVKAMYRALLEAFKRHRVLGGVLNVWEHLTTQKCHRCHEMTKARIIPWTPEDVEKEKTRLTNIWKVKQREAMEQGADVPPLELPTDEELLGRHKTDRNFRICEHCSSSDQPWKLRNRDFNAAINILTVLETTLRGEERPAYLCTQRAAGPPRRRRRPNTAA